MFNNHKHRLRRGSVIRNRVKNNQVRNLDSLVYLLLPGTRETLQGGFLEGFEVISGQFSVNFPVEISGKNPRKSL